MSLPKECLEGISYEEIVHSKLQGKITEFLAKSDNEPRKLLKEKVINQR